MAGRARARGARARGSSGRGRRPRRPPPRPASCTSRRCPQLPDVPARALRRGHRRRDLGDDVDGRRRCSRRCARSAPELDTFALVPPAALSRIHMDPEEPVPVPRRRRAARRAGRGRGRRVADAPRARERCCSRRSATSAARWAACPRAPGVARAGCAASTPPSPPAWSCPRRWARRCEAGLDRFAAALAPWASGAHYLNFTEKRVDPATLLRARRTTRACGPSAPTVDPDGTLLANHAVGRPRSGSPRRRVALDRRGARLPPAPRVSRWAAMAPGATTRREALRAAARRGARRAAAAGRRAAASPIGAGGPGLRPLEAGLDLTPERRDPPGQPAGLSRRPRACRGGRELRAVVGRLRLWADWPTLQPDPAYALGDPGVARPRGAARARRPDPLRARTTAWR